MRIEEKILILPALYIIKRRGQATTSDLIEELTIVFNPSGEDAEILAGRSDTKFSQKVRNLVSHRDSNNMAVYTDFKNGIYKLTEKGDNYLNTRLDELNYFFSQKFDYSDTMEVALSIADTTQRITIYDENMFISEGKIEKKEIKNRTRSKALRDAALAFYSVNGVIKCDVCGFSYEEKYGELGKGYIEIHHEKPICEYGTNGSAEFISEAIKNVKPLCANCHRMIHRNPLKPLTISDLKSIIKSSSM